MGVIDMQVRNYLKNPDIFAQLFNESLFDAEHLIDPASLQELDSVINVIPEPENLAENMKKKQVDAKKENR